MMNDDIRGSAHYQEAEALFARLRLPGTGQIGDAAEINVSSDGSMAVFAGTLVERLEGSPPTRICLADLRAGTMRVITFGPNTDRLPKFSPIRGEIAFLSDRHRAGDFQLYLLDIATGAAQPAPRPQGWVEYFHWSPDGTKMLLGVAGHGADVAAGHGAITSAREERDIPSWLPSIETGAEEHQWRSLWIYDCTTRQVRRVSPADLNVWEAVWCGNGACAAVVSKGPSEGHWYEAHLRILGLEREESRVLYVPRDQLGWPAASPSGKHLAVVEALCSDRWFVAGDLRLIDVASGTVESVDTHGVDVTHLEWRSEQVLLIAGHRHWESVVATYDVSSNVFREVWSSREITTGGLFISVSGFGTAGDCALIGEGFVRPPEIAVIRAGRYEARVRTNIAPQTSALRNVEQFAWTAPDGLGIEGWLLQPKSAPPHPLVMCIHGGPVGHWRPVWLGRRNAVILLLLARGYAIFLPNPRGSAGYGQDFARRVLGDMGGADTHDYLSGIDALIARGLVDAKRLGVTGVSYGGFMSAWLITQDSRFAAAVPVAPVSNHVTQELVSNIPDFVRLFLEDSYTNPGGKYFERSPVMHAARARTPTLNICGALDRCTPPVEAVQFHNALRQHGVESVLVTYPEEGHGIRKLPAAIDYAARVVRWFERLMPA
jgi:dipeptidyl aminopeptidase/acylaminoacyl peptidase